MEVDAEATPTDLRRTLGTIWRRKWWVIAAVAASVAVAFVQSGRTVTQYSAGATVSVNDPNQASIFGNGGFSYIDPARFMATQLAQLRGSVVSDGVRDELGPAYARVTSIGVDNVEQTNIIAIEARSTDRAVAVAAANAYADVYVRQQRDAAAKAYDDRASELENYKTQIDRRSADLSGQIASLSAEIAPIESAVTGNLGAPAELKAQLATLTSERQLASQQRDSLVSSSQSTQAQIDQLKIEAGVRREGTAAVIDRATGASATAGGTSRQDLLIAAAIGLVLGLGLAFAREALGSTVESAEDVDRVAPGLPVLGFALRDQVSRPGRFRRLAGAIVPRRLWRPKRGTPSVVTLSDSHSPAAEAYRALRTNIELVRPRGVVLVTSARDEDGKTTTVANLAVSLANAGSNVVVVDFDLRRARLHSFFDASNAVGLTSVLLGRSSLADALQPVPEVGGGSLRVLASGPLPPQPSELLGSAAMGRLIDELREMADYVVLDTPPVLAVSDPAVASRWADDVIVVVNSGWTTQHQLEGALERLEQAGAPVVGFVLNSVTSASKRGYYYYGRRPDDGESRAAIVPSEEWTRLVARPDATTGTNGGSKPNGASKHLANDEDAWRRLAGLRASLDEPGESHPRGSDS